MPASSRDNAPINPQWVTFWSRVRAAAEELRRLEAEQAAFTHR